MKTTKTFAILIALSAIFSCNSKKADPPSADENARIIVITAPVTSGSISDRVHLNGITVFLKKYTVNSPITGYIKKLKVQYGDFVHAGDLLFEVQTKENKAIEGSFTDPLLASAKSGVISVYSPSAGMVSDLPVNAPDMFVSEGGTLCTILDNQSLIVQVNVPFEYNSWINSGKTCTVHLPDSSSVTGIVTRVMPVINATSQTQNVLIQLSTVRQLPENLNVGVEFLHSTHPGALLVPHEAILTDEAQQNFWVMKVITDSIAVKVPVVKGFESSGLTEIVSRGIKVLDPVIIKGAYGLPDSTVVKIGN